MLAGDPDRFVIWFHPVESWCSARFKNGSFAYFIGGNLLWSLRSTISVDFAQLEILHSMNNDVEDAELFDLPVVDAYQKLCTQAYPSMDSDVEDSDYTYVASPPSLSDEGYCIFLIESNKKSKLIHGLASDLSSVQEVYLERGEFQRIVSKAILNFRQQYSLPSSPR